MHGSQIEVEVFTQITSDESTDLLSCEEMNSIMPMCADNYIRRNDKGTKILMVLCHVSEQISRLLKF
jgi:hypothetical protein